ncbi:MAG TPA: hypothetical protein VGM90_14135 [Kofleriaceae bacterium]|jgi:hypothetical protein
MSELAFNISGEPFELPAGASGWRVRRLKQKGAPEVVYGRDGTPLVIPLDADQDELRAEAGAAGRYRLDPIDEAQRPIPNAQAAYVYVHPSAQPSGPAPSAGLPPTTDSVVIEAMRMNAEMARSIIDRFPQMLESAATLLRAADGAGLPSREPRATEEQDEEEGEADVPAGFDLNALVAQLVPMLAMAFTKGKVKMPDLASALDWRQASPKEAKVIGTAGASSPDQEETDALPPIDPQTMAHFIAIQSALKPEEAAMAREVAGNLGTAELNSWFEELKKLTVPQAVQKIRVLITGNTEAVS